jgi:hypothetical protein
MVSLRLVQVRSVVSDLFRVANTVDQATGIDAEVFVFRTETGFYDRIASVSDVMNVVDVTRAAALAAGNPYYRQAVATKDCTALPEANDFATTVQSRLKTLVVEYNAATTAFVGTTTETYHS